MYEYIKVIYIHYEKFTNRSMTNEKGKFPSYYHLDITTSIKSLVLYETTITDESMLGFPHGVLRYKKY